MPKVGMTRNNTVQEPEAPKSSIEEQLNILHEFLDMLDAEMEFLRENLSEVLCPVIDSCSHLTQDTPVMSLTAEHIFNARERVYDHVLLVGKLNQNLNIKTSHPFHKETGK